MDFEKMLEEFEKKPFEERRKFAQRWLDISTIVLWVSATLLGFAFCTPKQAMFQPFFFALLLLAFRFYERYRK